MENNELIPIENFYLHYKIEPGFITSLYELQVVEITIKEEQQYIAVAHLPYVEKLIRLHHDLKLDTEALSVTMHLLDKIDTLQNQLNHLSARLKLYEEL